jgi:Zn-dependent protease with chaperone function
VPHVVRLDRVAPVHAIAIWTSALALRALVTVMAAVLVVFVVPHSRFLESFSHWCWGSELPLVGLQLEFNGHRVGDVATLAPTLIAGGSLIVVAAGVARAARAIRKLVARQAIGAGPRESVILGDGEVVLAAVGVAHPRVLVSAGALVALDDDELAAGLAHEHGHIARRHGLVLLFAELCRGLGRFLPGTRGASAQLVFHLERDADRWALAQRHTPLALAGAIRKAQVAPMWGPIHAALDGGQVPERIAQLLDRTPTRNATPAAVRWLASAMVGLTFGLFASAPATAAAGLAEFGRDHPAHACGDRH